MCMLYRPLSGNEDVHGDEKRAGRSSGSQGMESHIVISEAIEYLLDDRLLVRGQAPVHKAPGETTHEQDSGNDNVDCDRERHQRIQLLPSGDRNPSTPTMTPTEVHTSVIK